MLFVKSIQTGCQGQNQLPSCKKSHPEKYHLAGRKILVSVHPETSLLLGTKAELAPFFGAGFRIDPG